MSTVQSDVARYATPQWLPDWVKPEEIIGLDSVEGLQALAALLGAAREAVQRALPLLKLYIEHRDPPLGLSQDFYAAWWDAVGVSVVSDLICDLHTFVIATDCGGYQCAKRPQVEEARAALGVEELANYEEWAIGERGAA